MEILNTLFNIFASNKCISCGTELDIDYNGSLCTQCYNIINASLRNDTIQIQDKNIFADRFLFFYNNDKVRQLVMKMKSKPTSKIAHFFAKIAVRCIKSDGYFDNIDIVTHCPRKPSKHRIVGYDHSQQLAKYIAKEMNIPYKRLILRHEGGSEQKKLNYAKRLLNVRGKFYINKKYDFKRKKILLIDDIITTGSTVSECAAILRRAGARRIVALFILD